MTMVRFLKIAFLSREDWAEVEVAERPHQRAAQAWLPASLRWFTVETAASSG